MHANRPIAAFRDQPQTHAERLAACVSHIDALSSLGPYPEVAPPDWTTEKHLQVQPLRAIQDIDQLRSTAKLFPAVFGAYRSHALDLEAQNAARLAVLVWVLQQLFAMRHDRELAGPAAALTERVTAALRRQWHIRDEDVPIDTPYREWCTRMTRNYRMLPKAWRWV